MLSLSISFILFFSFSFRLSYNFSFLLIPMFFQSVPLLSLPLFLSLSLLPNTSFSPSLTSLVILYRISTYSCHPSLSCFSSLPFPSVSPMYLSLSISLSSTPPPCVPPYLSSLPSLPPSFVASLELIFPYH